MYYKRKGKRGQQQINEDEDNIPIKFSKKKPIN